VDSIDQIHQEKKGGRPVSLTLRPNSELMAQLKTLQIQFLHENREWHLPLAHYSATSALTDSSLLFSDQKRFCEILNQVAGAGVT
jgi:hypothetical protein